MSWTPLIAAGRAQQRATYRLAKLAGWLTFVIPALLLLIWALPRRTRSSRSSGRRTSDAETSRSYARPRARM